MEKNTRTCLICLSDNVDSFLAQKVIGQIPEYDSSTEVMSSVSELVTSLLGATEDELRATDVLIGVRMPTRQGLELYAALPPKVVQNARFYLIGVELTEAEGAALVKHERLVFIPMPLTVSGFGKIIAMP